MTSLRPYQERAVSATLKALERHPSALLVAPTGAGKTRVMSAVAGRHGGRVLVLQHRDELVTQNRAAFEAFNPDWTTATFDSMSKDFAEGPTSATFAMVQSLVRATDWIPAFDLVMVDECHRAMSETHQRIIRATQPAKLLGVTATPERGDRKGLGGLFACVADEIRMGELVAGGFLVEPVCHVADVGLEDELRSARDKSSQSESDLIVATAKVLDRHEVSGRIVEMWRERAGDRKTIVFCSTVAHAEHVTEAFHRAGVKAACVTAESTDRAATIAALESGAVQVVVNVYTLVEGFDSPTISCVVLLRPSSYASVVRQMIGRGLRTVDPERYPDAPPKRDCVVLDFGISIQNLGGLEAVFELDDSSSREREAGTTPMKSCAKCGGAIPTRATECWLCGYVIPVPPKPRVVAEPGELRLRPFELVLRESPFLWMALNERSRIATSDRTWAVVFSDLDGVWHAFAALPDTNARRIGSGSQSVAMSRADDFMRSQGDAARYGARSGYHRLAPTEKQLAFAARLGVGGDGLLTRYELGCLITARVASAKIRAALVRMGT